MHRLTKIIKEDMIPALGVTEPGAIAFAVARAHEEVTGEVKGVSVMLNKGLYKNAFTCGIPYTEKYGAAYAAALGALAADPVKGLETLSGITEEDVSRAEEMVTSGVIRVDHNDVGAEIYIDAAVVTEDDACVVKIREKHTNVIEIVLNGETIYERPASERGDDSVAEEVKGCSLEEMMDYIRSVPTEEIAFIERAFEMNMELFWAGLTGDSLRILPHLYAKNGNRIISTDFRRTAQLLCAGAIEARVEGFNSPAMSITGSGSHGIICTLPLYAYEQIHENKVSREMLVRATALSFLITMYIKEYSGRLSSFCGCGIAGGTGLACGLAFLQGAENRGIERVIRFMASGITGMICDGGNRGCAIKGITAVDAAIQAVELALTGTDIEAMHGINGATPEETMRNMGMVASPGMVATEDTILSIMKSKAAASGS